MGLSGSATHEAIVAGACAASPRSETDQLSGEADRRAAHLKSGIPGSASHALTLRLPRSGAVGEGAAVVVRHP